MAHDETLQSEAETLETKDETSSKYPGDKMDEDEKLQSDEQAQDAPVSKPPVPSGHILTKRELQVLAALLAKYSDEKLKQIDLTIQKKKVSGISREEIESSLRKEGLTMIADDLKDNLEKGVENLQHYEEYERALKEGIELTLAYLKLLFFGPPRSGKSSMRRRLMKEIINLSELSTPSVSTGVAESSDVIIKRITSEQAAIADSQWWSMKKSNDSCEVRNLEMYSEEDLSYISHLFCQLIRKQATAPASGRELVKSEQGAKLIESYSGLSDNPTKKEVAEQVDSIPQISEVEDEHPNLNLPTLSDSEAVEIEKAFDKLSGILQSDSPEELHKMLTELTLTLVNMMDVGGQPSFLDMLPALTIGSALFMLFFRLDQDFQKHYPVKFRGSDSKAEKTLESSYCIEEVLGQCMASIECFAGSSLSGDNKSSSGSQASSRALLFGTFRDQANEDQISKVESTLQEKFLGTKMYEEGLLLKSSDGKMFASVDNMFGTDESEMSAIREDLENIMKKYFPPVPTPASWLMLRIVLHLLNKPIVSLAECEQIAEKLLMRSPVEEALHFFHNNVGSLMHYSKIASMQGIIICNPQVIFDSISELIIDKFKYTNRDLKSGEVDEFIQKGQFGLSHIKKTKCQRRDLLTPDQLVDVLKYHNIVAEIEQNQGEPTCERKFIMPAVLKYASEEELKIHTSDCKQETCPLMIWFQSGFVPFGVFSASISHLIAHQDSMSPAWKISDKEVRKNKVQFIIDKSFCTTLISRPQYLEIRVEQCQNTKARYSMADINSIVRQTVVEALETVVSKMRNKTHVQTEAPANKLFHFAFSCCLEPSHSDHLMKVDKDGADYSAECLKNSLRVNLNEKHLTWFNQGGSFMRCPVCHDVQVDPCTLSCGHTTCQLCLARMWYNGDKSCPVCKTSWQVIPAISIEYREKIETLYSKLVVQKRQQYTQNEKDLIKGFLSAKDSTQGLSSGDVEWGMDHFSKVRDLIWDTRSSYQSLGYGLDLPPASVDAIKQSNHCDVEKCFERILEEVLKNGLSRNKLAEVLESRQLGYTLLAKKVREANFGPVKEHQMKQQVISGMSKVSRVFSDKMTSEQLAVWLSHHTHMVGTDYPVDVEKLKVARITGYDFLNLDKTKLDGLQISMNFQQSLMNIIEDLKSVQKTSYSKTLSLEQTSTAGDTPSSPASSVAGQESQGLCGVEVYGEMTVVVTNSSQSFVWKDYGLKLHIQQDSLPAGVKECVVNIKASLAGQYEFPENLHLVSAVFWLRCEPTCKFSLPVYLEIQHCANPRNISKLCFVKALCSQRSLPYTFKQLPGDRYSDSYGIIQVKSFSGVAITQQGSEEREYVARLFYQSQNIHTYDIHLVVTWNIEAHLTAAEKLYCPLDRGVRGPEQTIEFESNQIKLDIPIKGVELENGWKVTPILNPVIKRKDVDKYEPPKVIPNCPLLASFNAKGKGACIPMFLYHVNLIGAREPHNMVVINFKASKPPVSELSRRQILQQSSQELIQQETVIPQPMNFSRDMSNEQLALWLHNHPNLAGTDYQEDVAKIKEAKVNGHAFVSLTGSLLERFGVSLGFQIQVLNILENLRSATNVENTPPQQHSLVTSYSLVDKGTAESHLTSATAQSSSTQEQHQLSFSPAMSDDDFLSYLKNEGLKEIDCSKLSDNCIGAKIFSDLTEEEINDPSLGFSFGGKKLLKKIIAGIKSCTAIAGASMNQHTTSERSAADGNAEGITLQQHLFKSNVESSEARQMSLSTSTQQSEGILNIRDLHKVQDAVWVARAKWYNIGLRLGITADTLDAIKTANPEECFTNVIKEWLRNDHPQPTWEALAEAVRSPAVGHAHLAETLQK